MYYWQIFWTASVLVAGLSFAFVTVVVILKGGRDLKEMFNRLLEQRKNDE